MIISNCRLQNDCTSQSVRACRCLIAYGFDLKEIELRFGTFVADRRPNSKMKS